MLISVSNQQEEWTGKMKYYNNSSKPLRPAIAMIELIFALVVMGITLLSVPNLIHVATQSSFVSLQQEAIATAAAHMNLIMTKAWDENNVNEPIILTVTNGTPSLSTRPGARIRSFFLSTGGTLPASTIGVDLNDTFDDIDDANGTSMTLRNYSVTNVTSGDLIDVNITITASVRYIEDSTDATNDYNNSRSIQFNMDINGTPTTNIKFITNELTTQNTATELEKKISLDAFSCNIGGYKLEKKPL